MSEINYIKNFTLNAFNLHLLQFVSKVYISNYPHPLSPSTLTEMKSLLQYCNNIAAILRQTNLFARSVCKKVAGCCSYLQYSRNVTATKFVCKKIAASLLQCCKKEFVCQKVARTFSFII